MSGRAASIAGIMSDIAALTKAIEKLAPYEQVQLTTEQFLNIDQELNGDVRQVPKIADGSVNLLAEKGVTSIWQLFGKYLELDRDTAKLTDFLKEAGVNRGNCKEAAEALAKRMTKVGFVLKAPLPPDLQASARTNDTALASFSKLKLTELTQFKGISSDGGAKKLEAKGVTTTDALFAKFLSFCNEPKVHQPPEKAQEMYDWMKDAGLAKGGWAPTIIDQLVAKMKVGIDYGVDPDPKTGD